MGRKKRRRLLTADDDARGNRPSQGAVWHPGIKRYVTRKQADQIDQQTESLKKWKAEQNWKAEQETTTETVKAVELATKPKTQTMSANKKITQVKEFQGMMTCLFEHEVAKSTASYEWTGPKMNGPDNKDMWNEVLSFFRWTYDTSKSESQVRLFVNYKTKVWAAWAFPQTEGTGMTTREIDNEAAKTQRAQFPTDEGWFYYGTVHHHCASSAFQSSVDEANERSQDGIHITIGKINTSLYDIDARVYQSGYKLVDFDIEDFWDVGDIMAPVPEHLKEFLPKDFERRMLIKQMCTPPPTLQKFPDQWKANYIREVKVISVPRSYYQGVTTYAKRTFEERSQIDTDFDRQRFMSDLLSFICNPPAGKNPMSISAVRQSIDSIETLCDLNDLNVLDIMLRNDVRFAPAKKVLEEVEQKIKELQLERELERTKSKGKLKNVGLITDTSLADPQQQSMDYEGPNHHYHGYGAGFGIGG